MPKAIEDKKFLIFDATGGSLREPPVSLKNKQHFENSFSAKLSLEGEGWRRE